MNSRSEDKIIRVKNYAFKLDDLIGKGATGKVYKGINEINGEQVAVKIIQMSKIDNQVTQYLLACEKDALMSVSNPYVLTAYDILQTQQDCLIVTPLCSGGTLKQHITSKGKLPEQEALLIFVKLMRGYLAIRNKGFVHRDIKSSNVMFRNGEPLIIDFGYCQKMGSKKPKMFYNVGSPSYMSPEAYFKTLYSQKSDIWSLGIVLYQMLEGFTIDHGQPIDRYFSTLMKHGFTIRSKVSDSVKHLLKWILNPNFHERPSVEPLIQNIQKIIFSGNAGSLHQSSHRIKVGMQSNQNNRQEPVRISLKESQRRAQEAFQQKLAESRERFNTDIHQRQGNQPNQAVLQNSPIQMIRQNNNLAPRNVQNKVMQHDLFDRNLIKLSQSVYRPEGQSQHSISSTNNFSKIKQMIINQNQVQQVQQVRQNRQFVMQNKFPVQGQVPQFQHHLIPGQNNQFVPQNFQNIALTPKSPHVIQYAPPNQAIFDNKIQNNNFLQVNQLKIAPQYRSMIQNDNKNNGKINIIENGRNIKASHSKIFNAESVLSVESNQAFQHFGHFNNVPFTNSVNYNRVIQEQPKNINQKMHNEIRRPITSVAQSLIVQPQRNLFDSFQQKNQVFHSFIAQEQPQPQQIIKTVHYGPPINQNPQFIEQNIQPNGVQIKLPSPLNNHNFVPEHRQFVFQPFPNHQIPVNQNNRPFSPVASERQVVGQFFRSDRFGPQEGTARNFIKKAEPYFHMTNQVPLQQIGRQTMPNNIQRINHPTQNNFHRHTFIQQPLIHLKR